MLSWIGKSGIQSNNYIKKNFCLICGFLHIFRDDVNGVEAVTECSSSDFSLTPPDLVTFNVTQYVLDNFGQGHYLTETSFQIVCTFSSGGNGIDSPVNFTILLQQGEL